MPGPRAAIGALWAFGRPHTLVGTTVSVWGLFAMAASEAQALTGSDFLDLLLAWLSALGINLFVVGLNQLYDMPIDRINKPHLPLAAGRLSRPAAKWIVALALAGGLSLAAALGPVFSLTVGLSAAIGALYSVPPLSLKGRPALAALAIAAVRGPIVNLGIYQHFGLRLGTAPPPPKVWLLAGFMTLLALAIALVKDMPDEEGDRRYGIETFALRWGSERTFRSAVQLMMLTCAGLALAAGVGPPGIDGLWLASGALGALFLIRLRAAGTDPHDRVSVAAFYRFMWRLFYAAYLIFPLACLAARAAATSDPMP